jgi:hypothetical protein
MKRIGRVEASEMAKVVVFLVLLAWAGAAGAQEERISFVNTMGEAFENAKIIRVEPDGIALSHSRGITKVPLEQLPEELRARFNLDGANAARYRAQQAQTARARAEQARLLRERQAQEAQLAADAKEVEARKHADYTWHAKGVAFTGRFLLADRGLCLFQLQKKPGAAGIVGYPVTAFPPSERERIAWIAQRLTAPEREIGEAALYEYERRREAKKAEQAKAEEKVKKEAEKIQKINQENQQRLLTDAIRSLY